MKARTARPVNQQENELTVLLYLLYCKYKEKTAGGAEAESAVHAADPDDLIRLIPA